MVINDELASPGTACFGEVAWLTLIEEESAGSGVFPGDVLLGRAGCSPRGC